MTNDFMDSLVKHMTDAISNPGVASALVPGPTLSGSSTDWPMTIAELALLLDCPPAVASPIVWHEDIPIVPGICKISAY